MLAVSTMAVFYAAPVMAAKVDVTSGNLTGVTTQDIIVIIVLQVARLI